MDSTKLWLEGELRRQFASVSAPDTLWARVAAPAADRFSPAGWILWPVLALLMLFASGDLAWQALRPQGALRQIARFSRQQLRIVTNTAPACDFWSEDPVEIRNWLQTKGNIELDFPPAREGRDRLVGAKLLEAHGRLIAAAAYRAGDGEASFLVAATDGACLTCHIEAHPQM